MSLHRDDTPVVVAGLIWLMANRTATECIPEDVLTGPAVGAALGVHAANARAEMLIATPYPLSPQADRLIRALDPAGRLRCSRTEAPLKWTTRKIVGETRRWTLEGDPRKWNVRCEPGSLDGRAVAFANGNPAVYSEMLDSSSPQWVGMDIDEGWAASQSPALNRCLRRVQLVTVTRHAYAQLPPEVLAGTKLGQPGGAALAIKSGPGGIDIMANGKTCRSPAPALNGGVHTDVGAGDFLLGFLTARIGLGNQPVSVEQIESAYRDACPAVAELLKSDGFTAFADSLLGKGNAA